MDFSGGVNNEHVHTVSAAGVYTLKVSMVQWPCMFGIVGSRVVNELLLPTIFSLESSNSVLLSFLHT